MKCKRFLSFFLFALFASFAIAFSSTSGNALATSWTSGNIRPSLVSRYGTFSLDSIGFTGSDFFVPVYIQVHITSSGNNSTSNNVTQFLFPSDLAYLQAVGPPLFYTDSYADITFSYCSDYTRTSYNITSSQSVSYSFANGNIFNAVTSIVLTFADECPGSSSVVPSGSISITENGTFDVTSYAEAVVNVPTQSGPSNYHDDLQDIKNVAILVPSVMLVIYFFWAIYKMIMGGARR